MIVHLFNSSSVSGPERLVLPALAMLGRPVTIVNLREDRLERLHTSDPLKDYAATLNLPYLPIAVQRRWDTNAMKALNRLLEDLKPDLVHAHAIKASIYLSQASRLPRARPYPILSTHHGIRGLPDLKYRLFEALYRRYFLRSFNRVLAVSTHDYDILLRSGLRPGQVRLHVNGADGLAVRIDQRPAESRKIRGLWFPEKREYGGLFLLGVVGRLSAEKDHARVLRILARLRRLSCDRDWKCLMFGMGELDQKLREQTRKLDLEPYVLWMGYRQALGNELAGLDLLLSFSKAEGLPINLIEAGWAATPVMSTRVGGVTDLIPDERFGIGILPDEPEAETARRLQACLSAKGQVMLEGQAAAFQKRVMEDFTTQRWVRRLQEIYAEL